MTRTVPVILLFTLAACAKPPIGPCGIRVGLYERCWPAKAASPLLDRNAACHLPGDVCKRSADGCLQLWARPDQLDDRTVSNAEDVVFPQTSEVKNGVLSGDIRLGSSHANRQPAELTTTLQQAQVKSITVEAAGATARLLLARPTGGDTYERALDDVRNNRNNAVLIKETISANRFAFVTAFSDAAAFDTHAGGLIKFLGANVLRTAAGETQSRWPMVPDDMTEYVVLVHAVSGPDAVEEATDPESAEERLRALRAMVEQHEETFRKEHAAWMTEKARIEAANQEAQQKYAQLLDEWNRQVQQMKTEFDGAKRNYDEELARRKLHSVSVARGAETGRFRLDFPPGTDLYFEVHPDSNVRMKRDKPNGTDPNMFEGVRNGSRFRTTWQSRPGDHCNFYFKQEDVPRTTVVVWLGGRPAPPTQPEFPPRPVEPAREDIPPEPTRPPVNGEHSPKR